jgi:hypothetical protein
MIKFQVKILNKKIRFLKNQSTFSKANRGVFYQDEPQLRNQYKEDSYMREHLKLVVPKEVFILIKIT